MTIQLSDRAYDPATQDKVAALVARIHDAIDYADYVLAMRDLEHLANCETVNGNDLSAKAIRATRNTLHKTVGAHHRAMEDATNPFSRANYAAAKAGVRIAAE